MNKVFLALLFSSFIFSSCGGGDGGGSSVSSDSDNALSASLKRTTKTALRVVHGAIDTTPVVVSVGGKEIQSAKYGQSKLYQSVSAGDALLLVSRQNDPGHTFTQFAASFAKDAEYTVFIVSKPSGIGLNIKLITDVVSRPESGRGFLRIMNAYQESSSVQVSTAAASVPAVSFGGVSGFIDVASGPITVNFSNSSGGGIGGGVFEVPDRGELTLLVTGSKRLGVSFVQQYRDLD